MSRPASFVPENAMLWTKTGTEKWQEANATEEAKMTDAIELPSVMHRVGMESEPWAIDAENLDALIKRGLAAFDLLCSGGITAGKIYRDGRKRQIARLKPRGNIGILSLRGPLLKYETWLSGALGMETYETSRHALSVLLEDDRIKSVSGISAYGTELRV
jgi:hypothetical protein